MLINAILQDLFERIKYNLSIIKIDSDNSLNEVFKSAIKSKLMEE